ncbi:heparin-binding hemagglutinin [Gordonia phosphorivorans]|uniref:Heparin-binding hemagglutinin n=1 Tax=Gordonia phosphorivorans TaxID=1056982 RepID=A0ABV6HCP1_9ACTN
MSTTERTLPTPLYAVVGAGDVVVQEAKEVYDRLRTRAEAAQTRLTETRTRLADLPSDVNVDDIKAKLKRDELREELRKVTAPYVETATDFYKDLAERGEGAVERLRTQPTVQENLERVGKVYNEAVDLTEDALGVVSSQTRAVGERAAALAGRAADKVEDAAADIEEAGAKVVDKVADAAADIEEAGVKVAAEAKTAAAKIDEAADTAKARAAKAAPAKKAPARKAPAKPAAKAAPNTAK